MGRGLSTNPRESEGARTWTLGSERRQGVIFDSVNKISRVRCMVTCSILTAKVLQLFTWLWGARFSNFSRVQATVEFWDVRGLLRNYKDKILRVLSLEDKGHFTWLIFHIPFQAFKIHLRDFLLASYLAILLQHKLHIEEKLNLPERCCTGLHFLQLFLP